MIGESSGSSTREGKAQVVHRVANARFAVCRATWTQNAQSVSSSTKDVSLRILAKGRLSGFAVADTAEGRKWQVNLSSKMERVAFCKRYVSWKCTSSRLQWSALFAVPSDSTTSGDRLPSFVSDISSQLLYDLPLPPTDLSFGNPLAVRELSADAHIVRLEDVTDMQTVTALIHGYRVHLYALTPIVHWPTFAQDLLSREDQRSVSWLALLLSLMAYSIVQLPWSALAFAPVTKLRALHAQCYRVSDRLLLTHEPELSLLGMSARYLHHVYLSTTGTINGYLEEVVRAAQKQHLYKEPPEEGEVVDQEIRRRLWWLLCELK